MGAKNVIREFDLSYGFEMESLIDTHVRALQDFQEAIDNHNEDVERHPDGHTVIGEQTAEVLTHKLTRHLDTMKAVRDEFKRKGVEYQRYLDGFPHN